MMRFVVAPARPLATMSALTLAVLLASCASTPNGSAAEASEVTVTVINRTPEPLAIYVAYTRGYPSKRLGNVSPNQTARFDIARGGAGAEVQLIARPEAAGGAPRRAVPESAASDLLAELNATRAYATYPFQPLGAAGVRWALRSGQRLTSVQVG